MYAGNTCYRLRGAAPSLNEDAEHQQRELFADRIARKLEDINSSTKLVPRHLRVQTHIRQPDLGQSRRLPCVTVPVAVFQETAPWKGWEGASLLLIAFIHEERRFTAATTAWHRYVEGSPATPFHLDAAAAQMIVWYTETPLFTRVVFPFPLPRGCSNSWPCGNPSYHYGNFCAWMATLRGNRDSTLKMIAPYIRALWRSLMVGKWTPSLQLALHSDKFAEARDLFNAQTSYPQRQFGLPAANSRGVALQVLFPSASSIPKGCPFPFWSQNLSLAHMDIGNKYNGHEYAGFMEEDMFQTPHPISRTRNSLPAYLPQARQ